MNLILAAVVAWYAATYGNPYRLSAPMDSYADCMKWKPKTAACIRVAVPKAKR